MRRGLLLVALLCAFVGAGQVSGASGAQQNHWIPFHLHMNAYAHWGHCGSEKYGNDYRWQESGSCNGRMEAGHLGSFNYGDYHSEVAEWFWGESKNDVRTFKLWLRPTSIGLIEGTMPYNWHTLTVTEAKIRGYTYVTGTTAGKGEPGGPLYVDLSSHTYFKGTDPHNGYSLDLRGYLRLK